MHTVHILMEQEFPENFTENSTIFWWNKLFCTKEIHYSVQVYYEENFQSLRRELVDFVYELGLKNVQGKSLHEWFLANDRLSMWWCSLIFEKHPILMPEVYDILKLRALERMLDNLTFDKIILHGGSNTIAIVLKQFCHEGGIVFEHVKSKKHLSFPSFKKIIHNIYTKLLPELKVFFRFILWFCTVRVFLPYTKDIPSKNPSITMVSYLGASKLIDRFDCPYWGPLPATLIKANKNINWLFVRMNSSIFDLKNSYKQLKKYQTQKLDGESFHFAEEFLQTKDIFKSIIRYLKLNYIAQKLEKNVKLLCFMQHSKLNLWPFFENYYRESFRGWICLERIMQRKAMLGYVDWVGAQEYTLFPLENCPWERALTEAVHHKHAGLVYGAQHSVLRPTDLRYFDSAKIFNASFAKEFLPDKILVNGEQAYNIYINSQIPSQMLCKVEALRYLHLEAQTNKKVTNFNARRMLLVTSFFESSYNEHMLTLKDFMHEESKQGKKWEIYIKLHPFAPLQATIKKVFSSCHHVQMTVDTIPNLLRYFHDNGGIVWVANDTSVMVEAMYLGLPLLIQAPIYNNVYAMDLCPLQGIDELNYVYNFEDAQSAINKKQTLQLTKNFFCIDTKLSHWRNLLNISFD